MDEARGGQMGAQKLLSDIIARNTLKQDGKHMPDGGSRVSGNGDGDQKLLFTGATANPARQNRMKVSKPNHYFELSLRFLGLVKNNRHRG